MTFDDYLEWLSTSGKWPGSTNPWSLPTFPEGLEEIWDAVMAGTAITQAQLGALKQWLKDHGIDVDFAALPGGAGVVDRTMLQNMVITAVQSGTISLTNDMIAAMGLPPEVAAALGLGLGVKVEQKRTTTTVRDYDGNWEVTVTETAVTTAAGGSVQSYKKVDKTVLDYPPYAITQGFVNHSGIDWAMSDGTPVGSPVAGTVVAIGVAGNPGINEGSRWIVGPGDDGVYGTPDDQKSDENYPYGSSVVIWDGRRYVLLAHLQSVDVKIGDSVGKGDLVAYSGHSGGRQPGDVGQHLHVSVFSPPQANANGDTPPWYRGWQGRTRDPVNDPDIGLKAHP